MAHNEQERLRTFHLFAGAGGGILADLLLGHIPVGACEIEDYPRAVLLQRQRDGILPEFPIWDDITTLDGKPWRGLVDVVAGGFPCQDISAAGKGAGIGGERSGLWGEMARVIDEIRPRYCFVENSPMLTSRGLGVVLGDLSEMGYDANWGVLGADDVGAPHRRKRIWIVADSNSCGSDKDTGDRKLWSNRAEQSSPNPWATYAGEDGQRPEGSGWWEIDPADISYSDPKRLSKPKLKPSQKRAESGTEQRPRPAGKSWWSTKPFVGRVAHGVAYRVDRLKAIGNGQVPQCAATAWKILKP